MRALSRRLVWLVGPLCAGLLNAQIVVDPDGSGQFTDLQAAIDSAPANSVIRVLGGVYGPIVIDKSLRIMGDPAPRIVVPETGPGFTQPHAIELQGSGMQRLDLAHIVVFGGRTDGFSYGVAGSPIGGSGFADVRIQDATLHAPEWTMLTGVGFGAPGVDLADAQFVSLVRCDVRASDTRTDFPFNVWLPTGAPGVRVPDARVVLLNSRVEGGSVDGISWQFPPSAAPCPCSEQSGAGGDGIEAQHVFSSGTEFVVGVGSALTVQPSQPWGQQPAGNAVTAAQWSPLTEAIVSAGPMRLGRVLEVFLSPPAGPAVMLVGSVGGTPIPLGSEWLFLDVMFPILGVPVPISATSFRLTVPNVSALGGADLGFQLLSTGLSNPVLELIEF